MGLYEAPLSLLGFGIGTMLANFHMCGIKSSFQHACEESKSKGPMCFRCLMFNLSGPCELIFSICFIASWT